MFKRTGLCLAVAAMAALAGCSNHDNNNNSGSGDPAANLGTATPIKHLVVIFQENVSFDHYFGTYPVATNPTGEPSFTAAANTPAVNGLSSTLLNANPNKSNTGNGTGAANPFRLDLTQAATSDQNHAYPAEQLAFDNLAMDLFPKNTGSGTSGGAGTFGTSGQVMGYYDGNTVTALWNYAQHYAMSDNSFSTTFGPSTVGAINLISGQTNGATPGAGLPKAADGTYDEYTDNNGNTAATLVPDGNGSYTDIDDDDPTGDDCSSSTTFSMTGKNIGDLLNAQQISWGFFEGGFDLTLTNGSGATATTNCKRATTSTVTKVAKKDYIPHHQPFQYYASTANPHHTRPSSAAVVGSASDGGANHQYDSHDFLDALAAGNLPAVSFVKAPGYQDGHAGYSDPLDEQTFVTTVINALQQSPQWPTTAVVILYDDSDGWYDHASSIVRGSNIPVAGYDVLAQCTSVNTEVLPGVDGVKPAQGRCGYGMRQPLLVISPYAKANFVDHTLTDQTSVLKFIEDNWLGGQRIAGSFDGVAGSLGNMFDFSAKPNTTPFLLDTTTGEPK
jgi:phospholipase C